MTFWNPRRIVRLSRTEIGLPHEAGKRVLAVDPETLQARVVGQEAEGVVADVAGHEDLFPLSMVYEDYRDDLRETYPMVNWELVDFWRRRGQGFLLGGDWMIASTRGTRQHDGDYRCYFIEWID